MQNVEQIHAKEADLPFEFTEDSTRNVTVKASRTNLPAMLTFREKSAMSEKQLKKIAKFTHVHSES